MPAPLVGKEKRRPPSPTTIVHQARHRADLPAFTDALNSHFASIQQVGTDQGVDALCSTMDAAIQRLSAAATAYAAENSRLREELVAVKAALNVARLPERTQHPSTGVALTQLQDAMCNATGATVRGHRQVVQQAADKRTVQEQRAHATEEPVEPQPVQTRPQLEPLELPTPPVQRSGSDLGEGEGAEEPELPEPQQQTRTHPYEEAVVAAEEEAEEGGDEEVVVAAAAEAGEDGDEEADEREQGDRVKRIPTDSTTSDRLENCPDDTERSRGPRGGEFSGATFLLTSTLVSVAYIVARRSSLFR